MGDEKKPQPNISITQNAKDSENVTQIGSIEGDVHIGDHTGDKVAGDKITTGDVNATVANIGSGTVNAENIVGGDMIVGAPQQASPEVEALFTRLNEWIQQQENKFDQQDAQQLTEGIKAVVEEGEQADEEQVQGLLHRLRRMAPDIWDVAVTTFANPAVGVSKVIQLIAAKAKETG